jgi:CheY-like chemotaxis protein
MKTSIEILLVEDNPADARLTREVLGGQKIWNRLTIIPDGVGAMAYLRREGEFSGARRPDLILLDLNLPGKDGREVLAEIKNDPDLRRIPVVVLSSSILEEDVRMAYGLQANCYVVKPADIDEFIRVAAAIEEFWLKVARSAEPGDSGGGLH